jgi:hypothetical protein
MAFAWSAIANISARRSESTPNIGPTSVGGVFIMVKGS